MKQTAVEWLWEQMDDLIIYQRFIHLLDQAKAMEKEQIVDAYEDGYSDSDNKLSFNKQYYIENYETIRKP